LDAFGAHRSLAALPGVVEFGAGRRPALLAQVQQAFDRPEVSAVIDLSALSGAARVDGTNRLVSMLTMHRRLTGWPHRIAIEGADPVLAQEIDVASGGFVIAVSTTSRLQPEIWRSIDACVSTRISDPREAAALVTALGAPEECRAELGSLAAGEAVILST